MNYLGFEPKIHTQHYTMWSNRRNPALSILEQNGEFKPSDGKGYIGKGTYGTLEGAINAFNQVRR